jgi:hypothetical protein
MEKETMKARRIARIAARFSKIRWYVGDRCPSGLAPNLGRV